MRVEPQGFGDDELLIWNLSFDSSCMRDTYKSKILNLSWFAHHFESLVLELVSLHNFRFDPGLDCGSGGRHGT